MRIALAPNAFRGSLTALEAVESIASGLRRSQLNAHPTDPLEIVSLPLADGGDSTLDVLLYGLGGQRITRTVTGPDGTPVTAEYGILGDGRTAVIEMARASGVELIPVIHRNPLLTTSYGTGELINNALDRGCTRFLIGIGGSATVEGGAGCLQAMGVRLLDKHGRDIPVGGGGLADLARVDVDPIRARMAGVEFTVLCDVTNPLIGPLGAAPIFGPQKGATPEMVKTLDANLAHYADILLRDLGVDVREVPGGGAAGGFGAGLIACVGAKLAPGAPTLIDLLDYEKQLAGADLVITGEGKIDSQTEGGKAVQRITEAAARYGIPVIALAGVIDAEPEALRRIGISAAFSLVPGPTRLADAVANAQAWLARTACEVGDTLALGRRLGGK